MAHSFCVLIFITLLFPVAFAAVRSSKSSTKSSITLFSNATGGKLRSQKKRAPKSKCLPRFYEDPHHFKPCLKTVCFLFLSQEPFIILDPTMKSTYNQSIFPCKNRKKIFPQLSGIAFKIHQELNFDNAMCVWAGANCTFDSVVKFVSDRAEDRKTRGYMFGVTGLVAQRPNRISLHALTTVTIYESEIIILRSNVGSREHIKSSFLQVFRGFETNTWILLVGLLFLLLLLALLISVTFTHSCSVINVLIHAIGDHEASNATSEHLERGEAHRSRRAMHRASTLLLGISFSAFVLITILFYEISVVNFIFNEKDGNLPKPLSQYSDEELRHFSALRDATPETVLRQAIDNSGTRFKTKRVPWYRCPEDEKCYERLLNSRDHAQYMVVFKPEGVYNIKTRMACDKLTRYETANPLSLFSGGWYLGSSVPVRMRLKINQEILNLKKSGMIRKIIEEDTGISDKSCGAKKLTIAPEVLAIPLLFIIGPIVFVILVLLISGCLTQRRQRRREERSAEVKIFWDTLAVPPPVEYSLRDNLH